MFVSLLMADSYVMGALWSSLRAVGIASSGLSWYAVGKEDDRLFRGPSFLASGSCGWGLWLVDLSSNNTNLNKPQIWYGSANVPS